MPLAPVPSDPIHHCALLWDYHGVHLDDQPRGALIPRQILAAPVEAARAALPLSSSEELCQLALSPRQLMIDLAQLMEPEADHQGRGLSEQAVATAQRVWPSYQAAGEGLAVFKINLRPSRHRDDLNAQQSADLNAAIQRRLQAHFEALMGPNAAIWINAFDSRMMLNGSQSHRDDCAARADALGEAMVLERCLKPARERSPGPRV